MMFSGRICSLFLTLLLVLPDDSIELGLYDLRQSSPCKSIPKFGLCPHFSNDPKVVECVRDYDCVGNLVCCKTGADPKKYCVQPATGKLGFCPGIGKLIDKRIRCYLDEQCGVNKKCCPQSNCEYFCTDIVLVPPIPDTTTGPSTMSTGTSAISTGTSAISTGSSAISTGSSAISTGSSAISTGSSAMSTGSSAISTGSSAMSTGSSAISTGSSAVSTGSSAISTGSSAISTGSSAISTGSSAISTGSSAISTGSSAISTGSSAISTGSSPISTGQTVSSKGSSTSTRTTGTSTGQSVTSPGQSVTSLGPDSPTPAVPDPNYYPPYCPAFNTIPSSGVHCYKDSDCSQTEVCCRNSPETAGLCSNPKGAKPGNCPTTPVDPITTVTPVYKCKFDSQCNSLRKCCPGTDNSSYCTESEPKKPCDIRLDKSFGECPPPLFLLNEGEANCTTNEECEDLQICCISDKVNAMRCSDPYTSRTGTCPHPWEMITDGADTCTIDKQCVPNNQKCCKLDGCFFFCANVTVTQN